MMSPVNITTATLSSTSGNGICSAVVRCATHALRKAMITHRPVTLGPIVKGNAYVEVRNGLSAYVSAVSFDPSSGERQAKLR